MLGIAFTRLSRALVASLVAVSFLVPGVQSAAGHNTSVSLAANDPQVFKTVATGSPTNAAGRDQQFLCLDEVTYLNGGAPFYTQTTTPWVHGLNIVVSEIPFVEGAVTWPSHQFRTVLGWNTRRFIGNGLPNHKTGEFPVQEDTAAYPYYHAAPAGGDYTWSDEIPIAAYDLDVTVPKSPVYNSTPKCISQLVSGVATQTGVVWHVNIAPVSFADHIFVDPIAALPPDKCFGHPYDTEYHYHGWSWRCFPNQGKINQHSPLFGYALDGFGIYGPRGDGGKLLKNTDLDICHGHFGMINWDGKLKYMYHYHLNSEFPYGPGCLRGTPIANVNTPMMLRFAPHEHPEDAKQPHP